MRARNQRIKQTKIDLTKISSYNLIYEKIHLNLLLQNGAFMSDKFDKMIKEISIKNNNDSTPQPSGSTQGISDRFLIRDNKQAQKALLDNFKTEIEEISNRWAQEAKTQAEETLNSALEASKKALEKSLEMSQSSMAAAFEAHVEKTSEAVRTEFEKNVAQSVKNTFAQTRLLVLINLIAAGMSISSALLLLFSYA